MARSLVRIGFAAAAAVTAALALAGTALAAVPTTPVFDPQPALVTPDQEGDGREIGWTSTFGFGSGFSSQRYYVEIQSTPPLPSFGTTTTRTVWIPQPQPFVEGQLAHHQRMIVHLRAGWHYTIRVQAFEIYTFWHVWHLSSDWASQSFSVPISPPYRS